MIVQRIGQLSAILMLLDGAVFVVTGEAAYLASIERGAVGVILARYDHLVGVLGLMFLNNFLMGKNGFYDGRRFSGYRAAIYALLGTVTVNFTVYGVAIVLMGITPFPRFFFISYYLLALFFLVVVRIILHFYLERHARSNFNIWKILLVGSKSRVEMIASALTKQRSWGHQIAGCLLVDGQGSPPEHLRHLGSIEDFDRVLNKYEVDEVVFALPKVYPVKLEDLLNKCAVMGLATKIVPGLLDTYPPNRLTVESLSGIPMLSYTPGNISASGRFYKRALDLAGGFAGVVILAFLYPFAALMIRLESPGPVLFKQVRIGRNGRKFYLYKFRTMVVDAEARLQELLQHNEMQGPMFKVENDPRITRTGRFLRRTSLDEFPQFINVLKGEMSLVGTRPPTPGEVEQYEDWERRRISNTPGITGLWQISGRNKISEFTEVVRLDLEYIDDWRFIRDIWILWRTVLVVLARKGAS